MGGRFSNIEFATPCGLRSLSADLSMAGAESGASAFVFVAPTPQRARPPQRPSGGEGGSVAWSPVLDGSERGHAFSGSDRQRGIEWEQDRARARECERGRVCREEWARSEEERERERDRERERGRERGRQRDRDRDRARGRDESLTSAYTILASGIPGVAWGGGEMNRYGLGGGAGGSVLGWAGFGTGGGGAKGAGARAGAGGYMPHIDTYTLNLAPGVSSGLPNVVPHGVPHRKPYEVSSGVSSGVSNVYGIPALPTSVVSARSPHRQTFSKALFVVTLSRT
jgi:hypothetical protein